MALVGNGWPWASDGLVSGDGLGRGGDSLVKGSNGSVMMMDDDG